MNRKFPRPVRRFFTKIIQLFEQINRYNSRTQLRTRAAHGHFPAARPTLTQQVAGRTRQSRKRYTAAEVKAFLQGIPSSDLERTRAIANQFQLGRLSELLNRPIPRRFYGRERLFARLALIIVRYAQKTPVSVIAESLSCFYKEDDIEEAIDYVSGLVAESLNKAQSFWSGF